MRVGYLAMALLLLLPSCGSDSSSGSGSGGAAGNGSGGAAGSGGNSAAGSGGGSSGDACDTGCSAVDGFCTASKEQCVSGCMAGRTNFPNCTAEYDALFECAATRPESDFHCDPAGQAQLNAGVCSAEVDALLACH
jgi:hypothetical protein